MNKLIQLINEMIDVFHGSTNKFDVFDTSKIGTGDGKSIGGWGLNFSDTREVAQQYFLKSGFVGSYKIPNGDYFSLDDRFDPSVGELIKRALDKIGTIKDDDIEEFQNDFIDNADEVTNKQVYEWLSYVVGSEKNASLLLDRIGFVGNKFSDRWNREATNYVIFDSKNIR